MTDFISIRDMEKCFIEKIMKSSENMEEKLEKGRKPKTLEGKITATMFFEPSTRTRLSFEAAARRLGGGVISMADPKKSSMSKGESFHDTVKTVSKYSDCMVIRHPLEGAARFASEILSIPVINGGDGANQHPTQTLLDLYTLHKLSGGKIKDMKVALVGDLKHARVMHSLYFALSMLGSKVTLSAPSQLKMPENIEKEVLEKFGEKAEYAELENLDVDVLYTCRIQKERFVDENELRKVRAAYKITKDVLKNAKLMHPLPKVDEISEDIEKSKKAIYFEQAGNGIPVRMAILSEAVK